MQIPVYTHRGRTVVPLRALLGAQVRGRRGHTDHRHRAAGDDVILLHWEGGRRPFTAEALPGIIRSIRMQGYEIVPASERLGIPAACQTR